MSRADRDRLDLERRIRRLAPLDEPPTGVRTRLLGRVDAALAREHGGRLDRALARPWPWLAAAAALLLVLLAGQAAERAFRSRVGLPAVADRTGAGDREALRRFLRRDRVFARARTYEEGGTR